MFTLKIDKIIKHSDSISTLFFNSKLKSYPGQFIMLNLPEYEEIPLSLSSPNSVTVKAVGETTKALIRIRAGERVGIRGPFGRPFSFTNKRALLVAGGIGAAPLFYLHDYLSSRGAEVEVLYGARTSEELVWKDKFTSVEFSTDDGSEGYKGTVVELMEEKNLNGFDRIYICGPQAMIKEALNRIKKMNLLERTEFSLERYMRCGIGLCGSCVLEDGSRVCVEGPVFNAKEIEEVV
jgi:dihydroorotate dehydrogenase electron transfer subunit